MANTLTLSSAVVAGGPFEQQGSIDWVQIARMSVSVPISILARVTAADVSPLTIVVGQEMSSLFRLSATGHERLIRALGELKSFSAIGDVIWFGFGIKHIVRVLAETGKGLTCLTLCACLAEIHTPKACAEILMRLADVCDAPDDLRPSASQWINLVKVCSGTLRSTTFSCIAEQFMAFQRPHVRDDYADEAGDVAKALLAVARVSSGVLSSVTLTGGRSCGWIAAIGFYFLGLEVEIRNADNEPLYKSTADDDAIRLLVIYGTGQPSNQVQVSSTAYFISSVDKVMSSYEQRLDSILSGAVPWDSCLFKTFGDRFNRLMDARQDFGRLMGAAARVFEALTNSDTGGIFDSNDCISWFGFQQGQYGHGLSDSASSLFPELLPLGPYIDIETDMSVAHAVDSYNQAARELASTCNCHDCCRDSSRSRGRYCLPVLAETIIFLIWNVSALQLDADLRPYRSGLRFIYQLHSGRAMTDTSFGQRYGAGGHHVAYWGDIVHLVRLLDLASVYHTAQFLFTNHLYPLQTHKAFTAASVGGICFYFDILRNVSDRPQEAMKLHVIPGVIQTNTGRQYPFIADKTGTRSRGLLGFDWRGNSYYKDATQHRTDYQASVTQTLGGNISIPILGIDTGSSDLKVKLLIEESTGGLLVDLHLSGSMGACRVGAYTMLKEIIENSGLVECSHHNCAQMDQIASPISIVDGEGCVPGNVQPRIYLRRLAGNPLARCVGLLVDREWNQVPILRQRECIPCCIKTAANLRYDGQRSASYIIL
jgi:hypothetical protein